MSDVSQLMAVFLLIFHISPSSSAYELQDTIHTLKEENLRLQLRLDNLTHAVKHLKQLLSEDSKGISAETHQALRNTFCVTERHHNAAQPRFITLRVLLFVSFHALLPSLW